MEGFLVATFIYILGRFFYFIESEDSSILTAARSKSPANIPKFLKKF